MQQHYQPADTSWFAALRMGISVHWTAQTAPVSGPALPFAEAVEAFAAERFVGTVASTGAKYLLFTLTHALQSLPAPCGSLDGLLSGRTTRRDLPADLIKACNRHGLKFIAYYNHSCNHGDDPAWEQAVGYHAEEKQLFANRVCDIVAELGRRYGSDLAAWWFDSSYSLDPSGPNNSVTTDMRGFRFPWEALTVAAKSGHPERLVTYNAGMALALPYKYTTHQDYLAGEANDLGEPPTSRYYSNGLQNHRWICLDNPNWSHAQLNTPLAAPRFSEAEIAAYLHRARLASTPVTFNLDVDQAGTLRDDTLAMLKAALAYSTTR